MKPAAIVWLVLIALALAAEFILLALGEPLLSHAVWEFADENVVATRFVIFAIGVLFGHFWWPRREN